MTKYLRNLLTRQPTQREPLDTRQVPNSAGGYAYPVDDWTRLLRFLVLGSEGGSYYATERALTAENAQAVLRCLEADGPRAVATIVAVARSGRAPRHDPALFALALAASQGDSETRRLAGAAVPEVCRIGTHLQHFAGYAQALRGWGRGLRRAVGAWYAMDPGRLAFQVLKYQSRDGWAHRDLLRLAHPRPATSQHDAIFHWVVKGGWEWVGDEPHPDPALVQLWAFERAKRATTAVEIVGLIERWRLPREAIPTRWLQERAVWQALLDSGMPMTALLRNLATLTRVGVLEADGEATRRVVAQLTDADRLRQARVHPIAVLAALKTYAAGRGMRGQTTWSPLKAVVDALDTAFKLSFDTVEPTGRRWLVALDVSGSMSCGTVAGVVGLTPRVAASALALLAVSVERDAQVIAFQDKLVPLPIRRGEALDSVVRRTDRLPFGATDCAQPMLYALKQRLAVDAFVVLTDSETWFGDVHPMAALRRYRAETGIAARLVVVGMVANGFTIADPEDAGALDVVGLDTATPGLIADFVRGDALAPDPAPSRGVGEPADADASI